MESTIWQPANYVYTWRWRQVDKYRFQFLEVRLPEDYTFEYDYDPDCYWAVYGDIDLGDYTISELETVCGGFPAYEDYEPSAYLRLLAERVFRKKKISEMKRAVRCATFEDAQVFLQKMIKGDYEL